MAAEDETPWNSVDQLFSNLPQDAELIIKSGNANYRINGALLAQTFAGLGTVEGTCTTAADTETKVCVLSNYHLSILPKDFNITFAQKNSFGDITETLATYPKLAIYNSDNQLLGTAPVGDSRGHNAGHDCWLAGDTMHFRYMAEKFCIQNSDIRQQNSDASSGNTIYSDGQSGYSRSQVNNALANYIPKSILHGTNFSLVYTTNLADYGLTTGGNGFIISLLNSNNFEYLQLALAPLSNDYTVWEPTFTVQVRVRNPNGDAWLNWKVLSSVNW